MPAMAHSSHHHGMATWLSHIKPTASNSDGEMDADLDSDFEGSLSGLGIDLTNTTYNMSEALMASLGPPAFKQEARELSLSTRHHRQPSRSRRRGRGNGYNNFADEIRHSSRNSAGNRSTSPRLLNLAPAEPSGTSHDWINLVSSLGSIDPPITSFQYVLLAATSPATKLNEETQTYLNQGQSYEIKLKKLGAVTEDQELYRSVVRVVFHERRLQYMEREHLDLWRHTRPGERIIDIDIPLSYGLADVKIDTQQVNSIECEWDARRDAAIFVRIHCISTEFTARKHGGEKGVPFRLQIETYDIRDTGGGNTSGRLIHCASCQIKVFKPKGADRKHKTDREKLEKKSDIDREKYQPSYEVSVLNEIPVEQVQSYLEQLGRQNSTVDQKPFSSQQVCSKTPPVLPSCNGGVSNTASPVALYNSSVYANSTAAVYTTQQHATASPQQQQQSVPGGARSNYGGMANGTSPTSHYVANNVTARQQLVSSRTVVDDRLVADCLDSVITGVNDSCSVRNGSHNHMTSQQHIGYGSCHGNGTMLSEVDDENVAVVIGESCCLEQVARRCVRRADSNVADVDSSTCLHAKSMSDLSVIDTATSNTSVDEFSILTPSATASDVTNWLIGCRFSRLVQYLGNFSGADLLKLSRQDLIDICGPADGIRLNNSLHLKNILPLLTIYIRRQRPGCCVSAVDSSHQLLRSVSCSFDSSTTSPSSASRTATPDYYTSTAYHAPPPPVSGQKATDSCCTNHSPDGVISGFWHQASMPTTSVYSACGVTPMTTSVVNTSLTSAGYQSCNVVGGGMTNNGPMTSTEVAHSTEELITLSQSVIDNMADAETSLFYPTLAGPSSVPTASPVRASAGVGIGTRNYCSQDDRLDDLHTPSSGSSKRSLYDMNGPEGDMTSPGAATGGGGKKKARCGEDDEVYDAVYLEKFTRQHVISRLSELVGLAPRQIHNVHVRTHIGINIDLTDTVVENLVDHSKYTLDVINDDAHPDAYNLQLKLITS